jgi:hypothetical protein
MLVETEMIMVQVLLLQAVAVVVLVPQGAPHQVPQPLETVA